MVTVMVTVVNLAGGCHRTDALLPGHLVGYLNTVLLGDLGADLLGHRVGHLLGHLGALLPWHLDAGLLSDVLDDVDAVGGGDAGTLGNVDNAVRLDGNLLAHMLDLGSALWVGRSNVSAVSSLALSKPVNPPADLGMGNTISNRMVGNSNRNRMADLGVDVFALVYVGGVGDFAGFIDARFDMFG